MPPSKSLSCTACRRRKVRCDRIGDQDDINPGEASTAASCIPCSRLEILCETPARKRRGIATRTMADLRPSTKNTVQPDMEQLASIELAQSVDYDSMFSDHCDITMPEPLGQPEGGYVESVPNVLYPMHAAMDETWSIDAIIPRENVAYLVTMFFEFVYPLQPIVHQTSFMAGVHANHDKHDVMFLSLLASILAVSLIHIPKAFVPYDDSEIAAGLASRCLRLSRVSVLDLYDPPTDTLVVIRYFHAVYYFMTGKRAAWVASLAESTRLALFMNLHRETSYVGIDRIHAEMRRRLIYTLINADTSAACMQDQMLALQVDDIDVVAPSDLEDDALQSALQLSEGTVSRLVGFRVSTSILRLIRDCLGVRRSFGRPQTPSKLLEMARQLRNTHDQLQNLFSSIHPVLRAESCNVADPMALLEPSPSSTSHVSGPSPSDEELPSKFSAHADTQEDAMSHQVMKANIHTTRAVARMLLINSREDLLNNAGPKGSPGRKGIESIFNPTHIGAETMQNNITDLLNALNSIPIQAVAANSHSLVNKVRSVVVTLLDSEQSSSSSGQGTTGDQYEGVLLSFLTLLTEIENLCPVVPIAV